MGEGREFADDVYCDIYLVGLDRFIIYYINKILFLKLI